MTDQPDVREDALPCMSCGEVLHCKQCESWQARPESTDEQTGKLNQLGLELVDRDERLALAEEVAGTLALYIGLGLLDELSVSLRARLGVPVVAWMNATGWPSSAAQRVEDGDG